MSEQIEDDCEAYLLKPVNRKLLVRTLLPFLAHHYCSDLNTAMASERDLDTSPHLEPLDVSTLEQWGELLHCLKQDVLAQWRHMDDSASLNQLEAFGEQMRDLGLKYQYSPLARWGEQLYLQATSFSMEEVYETLQNLPKVLEKLESRLSSSHQTDAMA